MFFVFLFFFCLTFHWLKPITLTLHWDKNSKHEKTPKAILNLTHNYIFCTMFINKFMDNKKKGRKDLPLLLIWCYCFHNKWITYGSSCAMMGNTSCNNCFRSRSSSTFIMMLVCAGGSFDYVALKSKMLILKVLLG